jgi:small multidrug resistance pump
MSPWLLLIGAALLNAAANTALRRAALGSGGTGVWIEVFFSPWFVLGAALLALNLAAYTLALRQIAPSLAYPLVVGITVLAVAAIGAIAMGETIGSRHVAGIALIVAGIAVLSSAA